MKAKLNNTGKILTGRAAVAFVKAGIATEIKVEKQKKAKKEEKGGRTTKEEKQVIKTK